MNFIKKNWKWITGILLLSLLTLSIYIYKWECREALFEVHFFSLNKGRSIFIRTPKNKTILIGGGQNSEVIREITKAMPFYKRRIDVVIIPSAVPAQIGGLIEIIDRYEVGEIIMPKLLATSTVLTQLLRKIKENKIHIEEAERGDKIEIEKDFILKILFPYKEFKYNKTSLPELGLEISYKDTSVYLMGNLSKTIQKDFFKNAEINKGENIIEYYNSASDTKVSADLIETINPKFIFNTKEKTRTSISNGYTWNLK